MTTPTVKIEKITPKITRIMLSRPDSLNAVSGEMVTELQQAFDQVSADNACQVVILMGEGDAFCSGLDMKSQSGIPGLDGMTMPRITMKALEHFTAIVPAMRKVPQPIIAAVHGVAYGIGFGLSLGADIRICANNARFNATGIVNGVSSAELGCSWLLPRLIGASLSNDLLLTGRVINADQAFQYGLVSEVVANESLEDAAMRTANMLCERSLFALKLTKENIWASLETPSLDAAVQFENRTQTILANTHNLVEAAKALKKKEKPEFTDNLRDWGF